jgi:hypothetical protein
MGLSDLAALSAQQTRQKNMAIPLTAMVLGARATNSRKAKQSNWLTPAPVSVPIRLAL